MKTLAFCVITACVGLTSAIAQSETPVAEEAQPLVFERAPTFGAYTFRMIQEGAEVGGMAYAMHNVDGLVVVEDHSWMDPGIDETLRATMAPDTYEPRSVEVVFVGGASSMVVDLEWSGNDVEGLYLINSGDGSAGRIVDFTGETGATSILRGAYFGLATAIPLNEGAVYERVWFSTMSGVEETLRIEVGGVETVETPLGIFQAHRLAFKNVRPENVVYVTGGEDRRVVRIDVVGQALHMELVDFQPG